MMHWSANAHNAISARKSYGLGLKAIMNQPLMDDGDAICYYCRISAGAEKSALSQLRSFALIAMPVDIPASVAVVAN